jgi:hypothetical protein
MTRGAVSAELAEEMVERFPNVDLVTATVEAFAEEPEPIGDELSALDLLAKHERCLGRTDPERFEDIVAAFPAAQTVICPEQCSSTPSPPRFGSRRPMAAS